MPDGNRCLEKNQYKDEMDGTCRVFCTGWSRETSLIKGYLSRALSKMGKQIHREEHSRQREKQVQWLSIHPFLTIPLLHCRTGDLMSGADC